MTFAKKGIILEMDVVKLDMRLLLSKNVMKKAQIKIDLTGDNVAAFGNQEKLLATSGSHYCMDLIFDVNKTKEKE